MAAPADPPATGAAAAGSAEAAAAQAPASSPVMEFFDKVEFSGIVDAYYTYNFNEPATAEFTQYRNFDVRHNQFSLGLLEFAAGRAVSSDDPVGFRFDLQYGQVAQIFNGDPVDNNALVNVQQGYISYYAPIGSGLTFDFGKFVTPIGTEPTESKDNFNYSRSFLYALGPYYHVGGRVGYAINDKVALTGLVVNGWNASGDNNSGKTVGAGVTVKPTAAVTFVQNVMFGPEQADDSSDKRFYSDTNLMVAANDKVMTGLNYVYGADSVGGADVSWQGIALYLRGQITEAFALAPRVEWFDDKDGMASGTPQALKEFTMTAEVKQSKGLIFRAEYRRDWSDEDVFIKNGNPTSSQNTFTFAFIYSFSSKAP